MPSPTICVDCSTEITRGSRGPKLRCSACKKLRANALNRASYQKFRDERLARGKKYRLENADKHRACSTAWYEANKDRARANHVAWMAQNKEKLAVWYEGFYRDNKDRLQAKNKIWYQANKPRQFALNAKRRGVQLQATPIWADHDKITDIYAECERLTKDTGVVHHVDHIVPLQSKFVCGLHVEHNLQILTAFDNLSKKNRFWPDMFANSST